MPYSAEEVPLRLPSFLLSSFSPPMAAPPLSRDRGNLPVFLFWSWPGSDRFFFFPLFFPPRSSQPDDSAQELTHLLFFPPPLFSASRFYSISFPFFFGNRRFFLTMRTRWIPPPPPLLSPSEDAGTGDFFTAPPVFSDRERPPDGFIGVVTRGRASFFPPFSGPGIDSFGTRCRIARTFLLGHLPAIAGAGLLPFSSPLVMAVSPLRDGGKHILSSPLRFGRW